MKPIVSLIEKYGWNGILSIFLLSPIGLLDPVCCCNEDGRSASYLRRKYMFSFPWRFLQVYSVNKNLVIGTPTDDRRN